jgi:hypothetical protein
LTAGERAKFNTIDFCTKFCERSFLFDATHRAFTRARFGLLVQSVQPGGACEHAGLRQGDVIIGVGSSLLDSTMSYV